MTISEMISVLIAYKSGKPIECRVIDTEVWYDIPSPGFNFEKNEYRVKVPKTEYRVGVFKSPPNTYSPTVFINTVKEDEQKIEQNSNFSHWETPWQQIK